MEPQICVRVDWTHSLVVLGGSDAFLDMDGRDHPLAIAVVVSLLVQVRPDGFRDALAHGAGVVSLREDRSRRRSRAHPAQQLAELAFQLASAGGDGLFGLEPHHEGDVRGRGGVIEKLDAVFLRDGRDVSLGERRERGDGLGTVGLPA